MNPTAPPIFDVPNRTSRRGEPAWEIALLYPPQGNWTEDEYLALDTSRLVELSDGCLEVLPMPTFLHQFVAKYLFALLNDFVNAQARGVVLFAPLPVRLRAGTYREPDIMYFRPERVVDMRKQPEGADLVMEVVSEGPENRKRDLEIKRIEYAAADIPEYWIVDSEERQITVLTLQGKQYREHGVFRAGMEATSVLLPGFSVAVDAVFAAGEGHS
jgi:Uma2 family endonuclease